MIGKGDERRDVRQVPGRGAAALAEPAVRPGQGRPGGIVENLVAQSRVRLDPGQIDHGHDAAPVPAEVS